MAETLEPLRSTLRLGSNPAPGDGGLMTVPAVLLALVGLTAGLSGCNDAPTKPRQAQTVKLLPDTPPPPPPKQEEKRPEPKREDKPQPQTPQPKPQETPQAQALKSDEAPGQGAGSGLTSGAVTQDYTGGAPGAGTQVGGGDGGTNRLVANAYAGAATRAINDHLNRDKDLKQADYRLQVHVWLQADGRLERAELLGSTGNTDLDTALRRALERFPGARGPLPERLPQPLRLQVSNRLMG